MGLQNAFGDLALDATLATIRDQQYRRTDPLPAGTNSIGHVSTSLQAVVLLNLASAARTASGTAGPYDTSKLSRVALDVTISAVSGAVPSMTLVVERQGANELWYPIYTSAPISAIGTVSTSIGNGMVVPQGLAESIRFRWAVTGTMSSFTFTASIVGK